MNSSTFQPRWPTVDWVVRELRFYSAGIILSGFGFLLISASIVGWLLLTSKHVFTDGSFMFGHFLLDVFTIFIFVLWFWLLITVLSDLFRRYDISGFGKAIWVIALILLPYLGLFIYLISQSRGMAERNSQRARQAREELRDIVGFSAANEIEKLERLKNAGTISDREYSRLRARLVQ